MTTARTTSEIRAQVETMLLAGQRPKQVAQALRADGCTLFGADATDAEDVVALPGWVADDGDAEVEFPAAASGAAAAQEYVDGGDWGCDDDEAPSTSWVTVYAWRVALRVDNGAIVEEVVGRDGHKIAIEPTEPDCSDDDGHDWQSPVEIVGGIDENPGVRGNGGGVIIDECCMHCGCQRQTDTWAQDYADGEQGLTSVTYRPGHYEMPES